MHHRGSNRVKHLSVSGTHRSIGSLGPVFRRGTALIFPAAAALLTGLAGACGGASPGRSQAEFPEPTASSPASEPSAVTARNDQAPVSIAPAPASPPPASDPIGPHEDHDPAAVEGRLTKEHIWLAIRQRHVAVEACYRAIVEREPETMGRIVVFFEIHEDGVFRNLAIRENTSGSHELEECVIRALDGVSIPPGLEEPVKVNYPFNFSTG
jgi:hypothetical protein